MSEINELISSEDIRRAFPLFKELRPNTTLKGFEFAVLKMAEMGYRMFGLFDGGELVSVLGLEIWPHMQRGSELHVRDLVTKEEHRSKGYGSSLMEFAENLGRESCCSRIVLHSRLEREDAHRFYEERLGFRRYAVVFEKSLASYERDT